MAGRRPGPAPKNPEARARTNADPFVGGDGWTQIDGDPNEDYPEVPTWVPQLRPETYALYEQLAQLPQAKTWGQGTWMELHLTLPLLDLYLQKRGSEAFKAIITTLGAGLSLTEMDMQKARIRVRDLEIEAEQASEATLKANGVTSLEERRKRLMNG